MKIILMTFISACLIISLNSCAQNNAKSKTVPIPKTMTKEDLSKYSQATFSAGCFWCEEAVFESVKGVQEAISGYAGGTEQNPTYEEVGSGSTGHAETVNVYYDPAKISYETLLKVYFASEDPTQVNGQGPDQGTQYRSIIFYRNPSEKKQAEDYIAMLNASGKFNKPIAAQVVPFVKFWEAEAYHQNYVVQNPNQPYVVHESIPRIKRFQAQVPELIKPDHKF
ncbi:MAG: peptide-methionine (S)-S-oxide reductase MsrA [Chitinophagaceae bacterium]